MFKNNPFVHLWRMMWRHSQGNHKNVIVFLILFSLAQLAFLAEPLFIAHIFNDVQYNQSDPHILWNIMGSLGLFVLMTVLFWMFNGPGDVMEARNAFLVKKRYREDMISKVLDLPAAWHVHHHSGDTIDKINKAADKLYDFSKDIQYILQNAFNLFSGHIPRGLPRTLPAKQE